MSSPRTYNPNAEGTDRKNTNLIPELNFDIKTLLSNIEKERDKSGNRTVPIAIANMPKGN